MVTACSNFAVIREKIQLTQDNRHVQLFKSRYDQLFAEFHEKLFAEYKGVKESYVQEYQDNYQMNLNEKQANIDQFVETIDDKKQQVFSLDKLKEQNMSCLARFLEIKHRLYMYKICLKVLKAHTKRNREKKRVAAYSRNTVYRNSLSRFFKGWATATHAWGKERINSEEAVYRRNLETERLTMWSSKVDQLMLYMAQLEDKIKTEVQARE